MSLAPELEHMLSRVANLQQQVHQGELSPDQAQVALDSLVAFDASGQRWQVTMRAGEPVFLAAPPGQAVHPADPATFQRPQPSVPPNFDNPVDDLMTPPRRPAANSDAQVLGSIFDGIERPAQPTMSDGAPPNNTMNGAPQGAMPTGGNVSPDGFAYPQSTSSDSKIKTAKNKATGLLSPLLGKLGPNKRLVGIAVVCTIALVAVIAVQSRNAPPEPQAAECPELPFALGGLKDQNRLDLAACLNSLPGTDPTVLQIVLGPNNQLIADATVNRQGLLFAMGSLYTFASPSPPAPIPVDLSTVTPSLQPGVQTAVNAELVTPGTINPTENVTRGQAAILLARLLRATRSDLPTDGTTAPDAPSVEMAADQALLAALGISDTPAGAAYGFNNPFTAFAYIDMLGRTYEYLAETGSSSVPTDLPPQASVDAAVAVLNSGDAAAIRSLVTSETTGAISLQVAQFVGLPSVGLKVTGAAPRSVDGVAKSEIQMNAEGVVTTTADLVWVATEAGWKLETLPDLSAS